MGEARDLMDQVTEAFFSGDASKAAELYASDAVVEAPDAGEMKGGDEVVGWIRQFIDAFPDVKYEPMFSYESGNTAIDEGHLVGTNTGELQLPTGEKLPPTGKRIRIRGCDVATVENGRIISHRFYYDQMEFLGQLGLMPPPA
jgi:ketosteroid isomerase-like protein